MKRTVDEHAERFDAKADTYDDDADPTYRACADLVVERAAPDPDDTVLDLGTGTGAIALALAPEAGRVVGRDPSEGMLARARERADARGLDVSFGEGRFRDPAVDAGLDVDVVVSNFAMHHLDDAAKRAAVDVVADLSPRRFVLGDVMLFGDRDPAAPFFDPAVDDPATVGVLVDAFTDAGFAVTAADRVDDQAGVLTGER